MQAQHIRWAMQHDWYSHSNGDVVYVTDSMTGQLKAFNDYQELRAWAGY